MASIASSAEADLTQVIPLLVDGIAQEIGADRRDMRVTFVADHRKQDMTAWKELKGERNGRNQVRLEAPE